MSALTKALVAARLELRGTVFKGGNNSHQKYAYVSHENVLMSGAREALLKHGLILEQRSVEYVCELPKAQLWKGTHALCHENGAEQLYTFSATTQGNDKSAMVASTTLDKTAILRVLLLAGSAEDDAEHDSHDRQTPEPSRAVQAHVATQTKWVEANVFLDAAFEMLKTAESEASLIEWARRADRAQVDPQAKQAAWKAFGERCKAVGLIPAEVVAQARR